MKRAVFALAVLLSGSFLAASAQASGDEYYERGEYGGRGYYGGGYGGGYYEGKLYGVVEAMPAGGVFGTWRVNGREVVVTERTFIKEEYGRLGIGAQVEVKGGGNPFMAYEVEVKGSGRAMMGPPPAGFSRPMPPPVIGGGVPANPPMSPPASAMPGAALIPFSGSVEAMPQGSLLFGMWKIGGKDVVITDRTIIKQQNGQLALGAQVEVKGSGGIPFIAHEIEVKARAIR
ncbi:DUF5666 domain-containing protein [Candidatus Electronema sp. JM]|uniref:DUF5666 domain-containing protein n=1 Tax=Candidatus Electronema sp. JM TaxID=3401571 RepID=UPI003AA8246E